MLLANQTQEGAYILRFAVFQYRVIWYRIPTLPSVAITVAKAKANLLPCQILQWLSQCPAVLCTIIYVINTRQRFNVLGIIYIVSFPPSS